MEKEVLFRVTAADCDWQYMRGTGPGGQKRNKTESKVRCVHRASGATGESDETRNQQQNKRIAFRKMAETKEFKAWHKIECAKRLGKLAEIEENVINAMRVSNLKIEGRVDGKWVPIEEAPFEEGECYGS
jgi:peptide chain release factor